MRKASVATAGSPAFFHGTTIGLNALLERKGASVGLITTAGFRDVLEIGRMVWPMYQRHWERPPALVPRYLRRVVHERVAADGTVLAPLDPEEVARVAAELVAEGVESIAVCLLHSYQHPQHERQVGAMLAERWPDLPVTLSHTVTTEYREYERSSTAVADAMIRRTVSGYIERLEASVDDEGFDGSLYITRCDGGVMGAPEARRRSIRSILSGPASGVMGVVALGRWLGERNLIAVDMGGTSFDAALVVDGEPSLQAATAIDGHPLLMPVVEIATIGAGGGSVAWIDEGGALHVGPKSAGAVPGPVCYGRGGAEPTFTDAALVNGLIDPDYFLGGEIALDADLAAEAIERRIAAPLGVSRDDAASGIVEIVAAKMAATIEEITIGKGHDPRDFTLVAYGGGGPLVAGALASRLEIPRAIVPVAPATFSAWGMLTLDVVHDFSRTRVSPLAELEPSTVEEILGELTAEAADALAREQIAPEQRRVIASIDLRYDGQEHTLTVPVAERAHDREALRRSFEARHESVYGYTNDAAVDVVAYRVRAGGSLPKPAQPSARRATGGVERARKGERETWDRASAERLSSGVFDRALLEHGDVVQGPAIIEEPTATTVVARDQRAGLDALGNIVIAPKERA